MNNCREGAILYCQFRLSDTANALVDGEIKPLREKRRCSLRRTKLTGSGSCVNGGEGARSDARKLVRSVVRTLAEGHQIGADRLSVVTEIECSSVVDCRCRPLKFQDRGHCHVVAVLRCKIATSPSSSNSRPETGRSKRCIHRCITLPSYLRHSFPKPVCPVPTV
ncbi:hypothetical protein PHSY_000987 [Pseudozyma hubeiensis SY62]|uniref:Uncharacterized protein n=1 Tax=Pseudozyma hubeiensis (strain SY62) TaxID=1305764 RepID=R9NXY2_PSEHS|nr:hypothetical protein PHSY_000987 [Pseudozyma hubeiensis SY62]GAC93422.1 hypothetical protein PHSY_000987 [Pseudozyma hubeiensis SY62]